MKTTGNCHILYKCQVVQQREYCICIPIFEIWSFLLQIKMFAFEFAIELLLLVILVKLIIWPGNDNKLDYVFL